MGHRTRRRFLQAGVAAAALSTAGTGTADTARNDVGYQSGEGWPTFMHDPRNTGAAPAGAGPTGDVTVAWRTRVNGSVSESPAYADGTLFVLANGALVALDAATGTERWRIDGFDSTPTVAADALYRSGSDPAQYDRETRGQVWSRNGGLVIEEPPTLAGGTLYASFLADTDELLALDPDTGAVRWRSSVPGSAAGAPAVVDGRVFVAAHDGLVALDAASGDELWRRERSSPPVPPSVAGDTVVSGAPDLTAFDAATGDQRWTTDQYLSGTPAVTDGTVYATAPNRVEVYGLASGEHVTTIETNAESDEIALAGDHLYAGFGVYDRKTGDPVWRLPRGETDPSSPVVGGGRAFFVTESGFAVALATADSVDDPVLGGRSEVASRAARATPALKADPRRTGAVDATGPGSDHEVAWTVESSTGRFGPPVTVGGRTYVVRGTTGSDASANLLALDGGDLAWQRSTPTVEGTDVRLPGVTVAGERVYAGGRVLDADGSYSGENRVIRARRVDSGERVWEVSLPGAGCPAVAGGTVFADAVTAVDDGHLGAKRWRAGYPPDSWLQLAPAVGPERVYTLSRRGIQGLVRDTGEVAWERESMTARNAPTVAGDAVLVATESGECAALARDDGSSLWRASLEDRSRASPAVADGTVVVGDAAGTVHGLALADGSRRWRADVDGAVRTPATVARRTDTAFVGTEAGTMYALALDDGTVRWTEDLGAPVTGPPAIEGGRLVVATTDRLVALARVGEFRTATATGTNQGGTAGPSQTTTSGTGDGGSSSPVDALADVVTDSPAVVGGVAVGSLGLASAGALAVRRRTGDDGDADGDEDSGGRGGSRGDGRDGNSPGESDDGRSPALVPSAVEVRETSQRLPRLPAGLSLGDFDRTAQIGSGATADVYRATVGGEAVALKVPRLPDDGTVDSSVFDEFAEEAAIWARVDDHDHAVSVLDWGAEPSPWIALELMDAGDLRRYVGEFGHGDAVATVGVVAGAVAHAHDEGVVHTDLKPANVLFRAGDGDRGLVPKVTDWGIATVLEEHSRSVKGLTPAYSAPEQLSPDEYDGTDERTDVFQLGVLTYEALTGTRPFAGESATATMRAVLGGEVTPATTRDRALPDAVDRVLDRALATDPDDRYDGPLAFRSELVGCW